MLWQWNITLQGGRVGWGVGRVVEGLESSVRGSRKGKVDVGLAGGKEGGR